MNTIKDVITEADTFNALKRIPYNQMLDMWRATPAEHCRSYYFYEQYGWTHDEFYEEYDKRRNDRS